MRSWYRSRIVLVAVALLLTFSIRPIREALVGSIGHHLSALQLGRPLKGFPPSQLEAHAVALAKQELEARAALLTGRSEADRAAQLRKIERVKVQQAQVQQERLWTQFTYHPIESGAVVVLIMGGLFGAFRLVSLRSLDRSTSTNDAPAPSPARAHKLEVSERKSKRKLPPKSQQKPPSGDTPEDALELPLESEVERILGTSGQSIHDPPTPLVLDHTWEGWTKATRERIPPLEIAHLIALFASDPSRNYLGLIGFLSHQLALADAQMIRLFPGQKGVQIFMSTPDREQEIGELPSHQYPQLVAALTSTMALEPSTRNEGPQRATKLLAPTTEGYQVQALTLYDNAVEIKRLEHVRFLPAGW